MAGNHAPPGPLRRLLTIPVSELTRWQRALRYGADLARHCAGELRHDKAGQMAAALTYHTLFSLLPTLVLVLVALNAFVGPTERARFREAAINWAVEVLEGHQPVSGPPPPEGFRSEFDVVRASLDEKLQELLGRLERISLGGIGAVGVLLFVWGSTGLLATVERSFNAVFGAESGRPWYLRLTLHYTVITLGPLVLLAGQLLRSRLFTVLEHGTWTNWLVGPAVVAAPLVSVWLVLFLMFQLLPTARVEKHAAAIGSLVSALLLVLTRELFRLYVARAAVTSLYGALALVPLVLLLLYWLWLAVLFGLELCYTLGAMRGQRFKRERYRLDQDLVDTRWLVPVSSHIARAFEAGRTVSLPELRESLALPVRPLRLLLDALVTAGILHRLSEDPEGPYALARPASRVTLGEVLGAGTRLLPGVPEGSEGEPAWRLILELEAHERSRLAERTLEELAGRPEPAPGAGSVSPGGPDVAS